MNLLSIKSSRAARLAGDCRGSVAVEFAFIATPLLILLMGVIEGGRMLWAQNSLQFAVEQAARCAAIDKTSCGTTAQIQSYAAGKAYGLNLSSSVFTVSNPACGTQISATLPFRATLPVSISVNLRAQSCRPN